jgi:hypothetical protein
MKVAVVAFLLLITTGAKAALDSELSTWLDAHPNVKANMVWAECLLTEASATGCATDWEAATCSCFYNSPAVSYDDWPIEMKELLHSAYQMRVNNQFIPVQDPPPFAGVSATGRSLLSQQSSRSIYIAHLAQTLWWELHVGRWSITALNSEALEILLSGSIRVTYLFHGSWKVPGSSRPCPNTELLRTTGSSAGCRAVTGLRDY